MRTLALRLSPFPQLLHPATPRAVAARVDRRLQVEERVAAHRILLLHDGRDMIESLWRICHRSRTPLHLVGSPTDLLDMLSIRSHPADLVIAKDIGPDWLTVAATLIATRAFGIWTPFLVIADPSDHWTKHAVETAGSAVLIDERSSRSLVPLLVEDWLDNPDTACREAGVLRSPERAGHRQRQENNQTF